MLPEETYLQKCRHCKDFFWLEDGEDEEELYLRPLDERRPGITPPERGYEVSVTTMTEYRQALDSGVVRDREDELYLRLHILWLYNDRARDHNVLSLGPVSQKRWRENNAALLTLLEDEKNAYLRFIRVELLRYDGHFKECRKILGRMRDPELKYLVPQYKWAIRLRHNGVFECLDPEDWPEYMT